MIVHYKQERITKAFDNEEGDKVLDENAFDAVGIAAPLILGKVVDFKVNNKE